MVPWVYGFTWQAGNIVFLSVFYSVAAVILSALGVAAARAFRDLRSERIDELKWHVQFGELPYSARACRHVFRGNTDNRICTNEFDCRTCELHSELSRAPGPGNSVGSSGNVTTVLGLSYPQDMMYHRGHTWVKKEPDGTLTIGLDEFGRRIIGEDAVPELPTVGASLHTNGTGWTFRKGQSTIRILAPVDGVVSSVGGTGKGFYLKVGAMNDMDLRHLLTGSEIRPWVEKEFERLEILLSSGQGEVNLADGGELRNDVTTGYPDSERESILSEMFLDI